MTRDKLDRNRKMLTYNPKCIKHDRKSIYFYLWNEPSTNMEACIDR